MNCIDFDKQFERYTRQWMEKNAEKYNNNMDTIEAMMPDMFGQSVTAYKQFYTEMELLIRKLVIKLNNEEEL